MRALKVGTVRAREEGCLEFVEKAFVKRDEIPAHTRVQVERTREVRDSVAQKARKIK